MSVTFRNRPASSPSSSAGSSAYHASTPPFSTRLATCSISSTLRGCGCTCGSCRRTARSARPRCAGARCTSPDGRRPCRDALLAPRRKPVDVVVDRFQRGFAQALLLHADEPLRRRAEHDRRLVAPAMRIAVRDLRAASSTPRSRSRSTMTVVRLPDVLAAEDRVVGQIHAVAADRIEHRFASPYFWPTAKSSMPWPGAVCTAPVPSSADTWSPRMIGISRRRTDAAVLMFELAPATRWSERAARIEHAVARQRLRSASAARRASTAARACRRARPFDQHVFEFGPERHREARRQRPRRRRPDRHRDDVASPSVRRRTSPRAPSDRARRRRRRSPATSCRDIRSPLRPAPSRNRSTSTPA